VQGVRHIPDLDHLRHVTSMRACEQHVKSQAFLEADLGLYRPSTGMWCVRQSTSNDTTWLTRHGGVDTDTPVLKTP
jgi:hypothetical protein